MKRPLAVALLLYVVALHCSIAAMEILGSLITLVSILCTIRSREFSIFKSNRRLLICLLALVTSVALSLLLNPTLRPFWVQFGYMRWVVTLWGFALGIQLVWSEKFEARLRNLWMACTAITGLYGAIQCLTGLDLIRVGKVTPQTGGTFKSTGWFSFSLTYAYSMGLQTFGISIPGLRGPNPVLGILVCILGGAGIVAAMSRGAWIGAFVCVLVYLAATNRKLIIPAVAAILALIFGLSFFSQSFYTKFHDMLILHVDHSERVRFDLWQAYLRMFLDHPFFGVGFLQGHLLLKKYYEILHSTQDFTSHCHSNYLQFLAGTGIFGFVSFIAVILTFLRKAWRLRLVSPWGWSIFLAQLFLHIGGLTESNFIDGEIINILTFMWAMILVLEHRQIRPLPS